jgi:hypothetical protein
MDHNCRDLLLLVMVTPDRNIDDPVQRQAICLMSLESPGLVENCVGLYVPLLEFNQRSGCGMAYKPARPQTEPAVVLGR